MHNARSRTSVLRAAAVFLAALAATSCAGTAATPTAARPTSPETATARPGTPTYPGFESAETTSLALSPFSTTESGVLEIVEPQPEVFGSVIYVRVEASLLLAGDTSGTLSVFSLADPAEPRLLSRISLGSETYQELQIVLGEMELVQRTHAAEIRAATLDGDRLVVLTKSMLHVIDLRDPSAPLPMGSLSLGPRLNDLLVSDGLVTVVIADTLHDVLRLDVVDARDPQAMRVVSQGVFPGVSAARARVEGEIVFVTDRDMLTAPDLALYSLADPAQPAAIGTVPDVPAFRAWIEAGLAYIATGQLIEVPGLGIHAEQASLRIVDLSTPSSPQLLGEVPLPGLAEDLSIEGDRACVLAPLSSGTPYIFLVDLRTPDRPKVVGGVELWGEPQIVSCVGGIATIAAGSAGLLVVDLDAGVVVSALTAEDLVLP
ncbi:MAG: hypothetical protein A2Z66_12120 [Chloroflexi bacterium RBG_13_66_10]|nr:MAG: hypothetical protein A2Z66_12120 [Chloroflexi bacterium RBG_13_66_10]